MEVAELFRQLESNHPQTVEEVKKTFHENFNSTKESWIVNGLFDYYLSTSSIHSVEILVGVREPHDRHLFDKIMDSLKGSTKLQALTLLGHVVRRHPTWIYKITQHPLMKELLRLLKSEIDILPLMSALLVIIVLLPMIPALFGPFLHDIFEIFSRLAAWNTNNPAKLPEEHLLHLQVSLYALFHRLYGMYPCNFVHFLRQEYGQRENLLIFSHTIKPMLETVKMHPLLVTASKDAETANTRWKKMEDHDVIVECAKFALEPMEKNRDREDLTFQGLAASLRSRGSLEYSSGVDSPQGKGSLPLASAQPAEDQDFWSPSMYSGLSTPPPQESAPTSIPQMATAQNYIVSSSLPHPEGTSPPEAAIEATPETTPIKDVKHAALRLPAVNSTVVRALNSFGNCTPTSQPSSPMRSKPFDFPPDDSAFNPIVAQKISSLQQDRVGQQTCPEAGSSMWSKPVGQPTSPLHVIVHDSVPSSPVPSEATADWPIAKPLAERNDLRLEMLSDICLEDQEVLEINTEPKQGSSQRQCDSVLQEVHPPNVGEYEECQQESGSPCMFGGLHMPNSRSMLDFARRVHQQHRQRFYSQCMPDSNRDGISGFSTGSSPGEGSSFPQERVRRANSCPEMKKGPPPPLVDTTISRILDETEELEEGECRVTELSNGMMEGLNGVEQAHLLSVGTQTLDWAPLPYEHLFLSVFPPVELNGDGKSSCTQSPSPLYHQPEPQYSRLAPYTMLDKYIEMAIQSNHKEDKDTKKARVTGLENEVKILKEQLVLLNIQLHFERQRREVHAERNRRLLGKSRTNRALEEHNLALRDQLSLLQKDIEKLHNELEKHKKDAEFKELQLQENTEYWQNQCNVSQKEVKSLRNDNQLLEQNLKLEVQKTLTISKEVQEVQAELFAVGHEMRQAVEQVSAGEQLRDNVAQLHRKLILMGELQQRYRDRFAQLSMLRPQDQETMLLQEAYFEEVAVHQELLEFRTSSAEAAKARVAELETALTRKDMIISNQKRDLKLVEEEYHVRLDAMESKFITQQAINMKQEEHILELYHRLDLAEDAAKSRRTRSPDVSVGSGGASSFSPHHSPLSQSLGSPGGLSLASILGADCVEMKNLQVIVDQPEQGPAQNLPAPEDATTSSSVSEEG